MNEKKEVVTPASLHQAPYEVGYMKSTDVFKPDLHYVIRFFKPLGLSCVANIEAKGSGLVEQVSEIMVFENLQLIRLALEAYTGHTDLSDDELTQFFDVDLSNTIEWTVVLQLVESYAHKKGVNFKSLEPVVGYDSNLVKKEFTVAVEIPESILNNLLSINPNRLFESDCGILFYLSWASTTLMDRAPTLKALSYQSSVAIKAHIAKALECAPVEE